MGKFLKKLILVTSPPACGKTYVSKKLAENLKHVVYLDKDTLIPFPWNSSIKYITNSWSSE